MRRSRRADVAGLALRTTSPIGDLGLIDDEALVVGRIEARRGSNRAVNIDDPTAFPADQVVVVVADAVFESRGRSNRLDATNEALVGQYPEGVVDRLLGNRANLFAHHHGHLVRCGVGVIRNCPHHCKALCGDLQTVLAQLIDGGDWHPRIVRQSLDTVQNQIGSDWRVGDCWASESPGGRATASSLAAGTPRPSSRSSSARCIRSSLA